jgi:hypothetical protein
MTSFAAGFVYSREEGDPFVAGLADSEFDPRHYILFERLKEPTSSDLKFGFQFPYVEIHDQGWSGYGLIERVRLTDIDLQVEFNQKGERALAGHSSFRVQLPRGLEMAGFAGMMKEIFGESFVVEGSFNPEA